MTIYANNAHGIQLDNTHVGVDESQIKSDFIIAWGGSGQTVDSQFTRHVQTAYNLNIPLILMWSIDYTFYSNANLNSWAPAPENEKNLQGIKSALFSGTARRAISGLILDINNNKDSLGNIITDGWINAIGSFIYDNAWKMFKLPQWIFVKQSMLDMYKSAPNLDVWLSKTDAIASWKSATPNANTIVADWNNLPIPPDSYVPQFIFSAPHVGFSKYANTAYDFNGITDANGKLVSVPLWQYEYTKDSLYSTLNFVSSGSVTPTPNPTPTPTPVVSGSGVDLTPVLNAISGLSTQMTNLENRINGIFK